MALGLTQPLTEMSTTNLPGGKGQTARKADNFAAICEERLETERTEKQATWQPHKPHKTTQLIKNLMRKTTKAHGYHMYSP
jgi:hypothetical protein